MADAPVAKKSGGPNLRMTMPKARCAYPKIYRPDTPEYGGDYKITVIYPVDEAKPLCAQIRKFASENFAPVQTKAKNFKWPWKVSEDQQEVSFLVRSKHKPGVFDAKGNKVEEELRLGGGSIVKVNVSMVPHSPAAKSPGLKAYLNAVQILKLVEYQRKSAFADASAEAGDEGFVVGDDTFEDETTDVLEDEGALRARGYNNHDLGVEEAGEDVDPLDIV